MSEVSSESDAASSSEEGEVKEEEPVDLLVSLQGSPGAKVENGGFECWTSFAVERAQLPV